MAYASDPYTLVQHGVRCIGSASLERLASRVPLEEAEIQTHLDALVEKGFAVHREGPMGGWTLTAEGRAEGERRLAEELREADAGEVVRSGYERFLACNADMLAVCSDWQMRTVDGEQEVNDHSDADWDARVLDRLAAIDDIVQPIIEQLGDRLERFQHYGPRFTQAKERVESGDHKWLTGILVESYHTVWFELHEDLLASVGIRREDEQEH
jgi:hypothetical protein